jgi:hypothetical protein
VERSSASISFPNREPAAEPIAATLNETAPALQTTANAEASPGVPVKVASLTRLPPVETPTASTVDAPPLPPVGTPATPVSSRRSANQTAPAPKAPAAAKPKPNQHSKVEHKLPGDEFGVGTISSVRFKDGLAIVEFGGERAVPAGSILRAYHQFALTGNSAVCDLEVVDGQQGQAIAIARRGSQITSLTVGDRAVVLQ